MQDALRTNRNMQLRAGHGATFKYSFRTGNQITIFTCVFDSLKYDSAVTQIIDEHEDYFHSGDPISLVGGIIIPMRQPRKVALCFLSDN